MVISFGQLMSFFLMLARIMGVFLQAPIFNSRSFPASAKIGFAIWIALVLWFVTPITPNLPFSLAGFVILLLGEVALGLIIGLICNIIFIGLQAAGEIMDMQMGLSVATALDPVFGSVISVVARLIFWIALVAFLFFDGHHLILTTLQQSFRMIPAGQFANFASRPALFELISLGTMLWSTAIRIAAPIVLLIFLSDFSFGIVSRVAPQVNVFMLGFQIKPSLGLIGILFTLPVLLNQIQKLISIMAEKTLTVLMYLK
ncbi:flagellar biosynthetic protein FliR [Candidatus Margulisiibacteriota bacterium]